MTRGLMFWVHHADIQSSRLLDASWEECCALEAHLPVPLVVRTGTASGAPRPTSVLTTQRCGLTLLYRPRSTFRSGQTGQLRF